MPPERRKSQRNCLLRQKVNSDDDLHVKHVICLKILILSSCRFEVMIIIDSISQGLYFLLCVLLAAMLGAYPWLPLSIPARIVLGAISEFCE